MNNNEAIFTVTIKDKVGFTGEPKMVVVLARHIKGPKRTSLNHWTESSGGSSAGRGKRSKRGEGQPQGWLRHASPRSLSGYTWVQVG